MSCYTSLSPAAGSATDLTSPKSPFTVEEGEGEREISFLCSPFTLLSFCWLVSGRVDFWEYALSLLRKVGLV